MQNDFREVVITGATGGLGSDVIAQLQRMAPSSALGVSVRSPEKAAAFSKAGIACGTAISATRLPLKGPSPVHDACC
jgi:uncharacterized protein YbjT (DUF2867 family)